MSGKLNEEEVFERREKGFSLTGLQAVRLREYNALFDPNMRHFFETKQNQYYLYRTGQIDSNGRVIDLDKSKSKLSILEREFKEAEKIEDRRQKEEMEMRVRFLSIITWNYIFIYLLVFPFHSIVCKERDLMN
jgi:hypothetical protein